MKRELKERCREAESRIEEQIFKKWDLQAYQPATSDQARIVAYQLEEIEDNISRILDELYSEFEKYHFSLDRFGKIHCEKIF
ncbi:MAG: hypothetical protein WBH52_20130 [Pseudomonas aeruginosa]|uniref:hypothetical protein n=1 Tax=Achromobacter sp. TaxID=134375 RepID=UPI00258ADC42|nr:hypothetical protein [Achromobacter sp.]